MSDLIRILTLSLVAGCGNGDKAPAEPAPEPSVSEPAVEFEQPDIDSTVEGEADLHPITERDFRRMDIDQLDKSIQQVTGRGWVDWLGRSYFENLSATLGKPDYIERTSEDLSPTLLFSKFLGDAAASVCYDLIRAEMGGLEESPIFLVHVEPQDTDPVKVEENLSHLLLRYHGYRYAPGSPELEPWVQLFNDATAASGEPVIAWATVCVTLLRHPDFFGY